MVSREKAGVYQGNIADLVNTNFPDYGLFHRTERLAMYFGLYTGTGNAPYLGIIYYFTDPIEGKNLVV